MNAHTNRMNKVSHLCGLSCDQASENYGKMFYHKYHTCKAFLQYGHVYVVSNLNAEQRTFHTQYRQKAFHLYGASCDLLGLHYKKTFYHTGHMEHVHHLLSSPVAWVAWEWQAAQVWAEQEGAGAGGPQ